MTHKHIGGEDWPVIARMLKTGFSGVEIARTLGKDPSAVNRHIKHHGRIAAMDSIRVLKGALLRKVISLLKEHYSPEQIAGVLEQRESTIVTSTIYRYIKERAPHLKKFLRSQKGKYRRKRGTKKREKVRELAKKRRIDERPKVVERRGRIGDFEGDTMLGRDKRVRITTLVDRRSGYLIAYLLPKHNAELLTKLAVQRLKRLPKDKRRTLTLDNGTEFSDWERLEKQTGMTIYFAYPYHSWERGTNENTNGLLRQYFPKSMDFNLITPKELADVVKRLNDRPRKRLKFKSPRQLFMKK